MPLPISRVKATPWLMVVQLAMTLRRHWKYLSPGERARLASLLKQSQGKPNRLTPTERAEVRMLVRKLEPIAIARSVVPIGRKVRTGRR